MLYVPISFDLTCISIFKFNNSTFCFLRFIKIIFGKELYLTVISNIKITAARFPLTLQTLFFKLDGLGPSSAEIEKYTNILSDLLKNGARIEEVQLHSISRKPAEANCEPLEKRELESIADVIKTRLDVIVNVY